MNNYYDYSGNMDRFQDQLAKVGITKDMFNMDNYCGCTERELQSVVDSVIASVGKDKVEA